MKPLFTEEEKKRIQAAVGAAESRTSGEIVPYIVGRSDDYEETIWKGASMLAMLGLLIVLFVHQWYQGWSLAWLFTGWGVAAVAILGGLIGALLVHFVPALKRLLAGTNRLTARVHARSMRAFVEENVFDTRDRTGILLFVSLLEHRIEVLGDEGINQSVTVDDWVHVVERIQRGIKGNHLADGLVEAIEMCGKLLEKAGVQIQPDDTDEIPNEVRIREK